MFKSITNKIFKENTFNICILILYSTIVLIGIFHHEVWRDEADVFLFARDVKNLSEAISFTRHSGHPFLWHLIILPFAKLGFPIITMQIINAFIIIGATYLFLQNAKLPSYLKYLFVFNYFQLFDYSVVARNYGLSILVLFSIMSLYPQRFQKPILYGLLIGLLANTHFYAAIIAFGLFVIYIQEIISNKINLNKSILTGISFSILGGLLCLIQIFPTSDGNAYLNVQKRFSLYVPLFSLILPFFQQGLSFFKQATEIKPPDFLFLIITFISFMISYFSFNVFSKQKSLKTLCLIVLICLYLFYIFIYSLIDSPRYYGFVLYFLICCYWIYNLKEYKINSNNLILNVLLVISLINSSGLAFNSIKNDITQPFSGGKQIAGYLQKNNYDNKNCIIATHNPNHTESILVYLKNIKQFYYPIYNRFGSHEYWTKELRTEFQNNNLLKMAQQIKAKFPNQKCLIFIIRKRKNLPNHELLYENIQPLKNPFYTYYTNEEIFSVYKL